MQATRKFDWDAHMHFARLSCDYNPIHVDPLVARRLHAGVPIVHGTHALLWLLDRLASSTPGIAAATSLRVQFPQSIYVGDEVVLDVAGTPATGGVKARLRVETEEVLTASLGFADPPATQLFTSDAPVGAIPAPQRPRELSLDEMLGLQGCLSTGPHTSEIAEFFPAAVSTWGIQRIASLVCASCLVGMVVPGMHSMFSGLDVSLAEDSHQPQDAMRFRVLSVSRRFRLVRIGISAPGLNGSLETISRMPVVTQPAMANAAACVRAGTYRDCVALIVGGSRGLGELTAKLIAAGGGQVILTYAAGKADAESVVEQISSAGGRCQAMPYDVRRPSFEQLAKLSATPNHIYYFATPPIFRRKSGPFDARRFREFNEYYVDRFFDLVRACSQLRPEGLRIFYPSSSALDSHPGNMTEYSMSKAAGEVLCADLTRSMPGVKIVVRRLPRLLTDQTSSVVQAKTAGSIEVMLQVVTDMCQ